MREIKRYSQLAPMKRAFVEHYISTGDIIESYFSAGYKEGCDQSDKNQRLLAYRYGKKILSEPIVADYVSANKPIEIKEGEIDIADITDRMLLIMEGNIEQQVLVNGQLKYVKPSFRDQIEAGKLLNTILEKREKKSERRASKALTGKVASLIGSARTDVVDEQ